MSLFLLRANGTMRISRFSSTEIQPTAETRPDVESCAGKPFENLNHRCNAPLKLTKSLQARLPCRSYRGRREQ